MGVPELWDLITPAADKRVPLKMFVADFAAEHGRPIRVAVDVYSWLFEGSFTPGMARVTHITQLTQSFHARVRDLISLNVSFIFVFDGKFKPKFKRSASKDSSESYDLYATYEEFMKYSQSGNRQYAEQSPAGHYIKEYLELWDIQWIDAAGEGEAECAKLQMAGVVDYVISNDVDVLLFGATHVLRNLGRSMEDKPPSTALTHPRGCLYVTPIRMEHVFKQTGLDRFQLIFIAVLRGGDYNSGVKGIGITRAKLIALSGSHYSPTYKKSNPSYKKQDFISKFKKSFINDDDDSYLLGSLPEKDSAEKAYAQLQDLIKSEVSNNSYEYFGKNEKTLMTDGHTFPSLDQVLLYFFPILTPGIFLFTNSSNYQEKELQANVLNIPFVALPFTYQIIGSKLFVKRTSGKSSDNFCIGENFFVKSQNTWKPFEFNFSESCSKEDYSDNDFLSKPKFVRMLEKIKRRPFPAVGKDIEKWFATELTKSYWHKLLHLNPEIGYLDKVKEFSDSNGNKFEETMVKLILNKDNFFCKNFFTSGGLQEDSIDGTTNKAEVTYIWVPTTLIRKLNIDSTVKTKEKKEKKSPTKRSPSKKLTTQKSTLLSLGFIKNDELVPLKSKPTMKRESSKKADLLPGQSTVDTFAKKDMPQTPTKNKPDDILSLFLNEPEDSSSEDSDIDHSMSSPFNSPINYPKKSALKVHSIVKDKPVQFKPATLEKSDKSDKSVESDHDDTELGGNPLDDIFERIISESPTKPSLLNNALEKESPSKRINTQDYSNLSIDMSPTKRRNHTMLDFSSTKKSANDSYVSLPSPAKMKAKTRTGQLRRESLKTPKPVISTDVLDRDMVIDVDDDSTSTPMTSFSQTPNAPQKTKKSVMIFEDVEELSEVSFVRNTRKSKTNADVKKNNGHEKLSILDRLLEPMVFSSDEE